MRYGCGTKFGAVRDVSQEKDVTAFPLASVQVGLSYQCCRGLTRH